MKAPEIENCQQNGVTSITEGKIGYDGIVRAHSRNGAQIDVSKAQLFQALAKEVEVDGQIVANPHNSWSEIDPSLPHAPSQGFGPPPTSGTRDAWVELVILEGGYECPAIAALAGERKGQGCPARREAGHCTKK